MTQQQRDRLDYAVWATTSVFPPDQLKQMPIVREFLRLAQLALDNGDDVDMPGLLDKAVARVKATGQPTKSAWPIAVAALQKSGSLKPGTLKPTKQGVARNKMSRAQREANPPKG